MFDEKQALLEIVKAIEELRERRGTTSNQICEFVRQRSKNTNDPIKALRTAGKLNQLVDEGVLVKRGRRYMFPAYPADKKLEAGDKNPVLEDPTEFETEAENEDWLISDEESPRTENVPSRKRKIFLKRNRKRNARKSRRRKYDSVAPKFNQKLEIRGDDRSRSPVKRRNPSPDSMLQSRNKLELETVAKDENKSESQLSLTAQEPRDDNTALESSRFESFSIPLPSDSQGPNVDRKKSCCDNDSEQQLLEADKEEEILMKIKHEKEKENHRKPPSRRSSSKARERQSREKERTELIQKGRIEKLNRRSFLPETDLLYPESLLLRQ